MTLQLGNVPANSTLYIPFASYDSSGASVTLTGLAVTDIEIYKNGSAVQRASDAGYALLDTDGIDFDGLTGIHGFSIDLSDNTTAGFYTVGAFFWVVVSAVTIDGQTVNFIAATFRIVPAESSAGVPKVDLTHIGGSAVSTSTAQLGVNVVQAAGTAWGSGAITAASIAADAITAAKVAADVGTEIGTAVWASTTRLLTAGTNIALAKGTGITGFNDLDAAGVRTAVGLASANLDTQLSGINAKTTNLPTDPADQSLIIAATDAILSAVQTVDGVVDAIKLKTDSLSFTVAGFCDVNIQYVNDVEVAGDGDATKWGPA